MTTELLPCPFCGGAVRIVEGEESAYVQCENVKMHRALWFEGDNNAANEVAEQWNRRAAARAGTDGNSAPADDVVASFAYGPKGSMRNTHLLDWLHDAYTHCQNGSRDWCEDYLRNAKAVIEAQDAEIERLRAERDELEAKWISADEGEKVNGEFLAHADARLDAAERQKAQLVEALRPFAEVAGDFDGEADGLSVGLVGDERKPVPEVLVSDFRRARALIKEMEGNG